MTLVGRGQHFTYGQLEELWVKGGGSRATAPIAAAIAMAESSGWSNNVNERDTNGAGSYGLWQINDSTVFSSQGPNYGGPQGWNNPLENARMAVAKYKGSGNNWSPWGTYTSGAWRAYYRGNIPPSSGKIPNQGYTTSSVGGAGNAGTGPGGGGGGGFWGDLKKAAEKAFEQLVPGGEVIQGVDPFGYLASGLGTAIGSGIESGFTNVFKDIWGPVFRRAFWLGEMLLGLFIVILTAIAISWMGFSKLEGGNRAAIRNVLAAPETGGLSLVTGAASAQSGKARQQRAERQGITTEQAQQRIDVAQRRVAIQESQEQRRKANAQAAAAKPPATPGLDESVARARERARKIREARRRRDSE